jgi:hypothetical protein
MKVIFLDIDGVLNHELYYRWRHKEMSDGKPFEEFRDDYGDHFSQDSVNNLQKILNETNAKIVISSTWRMSGLKIMLEMWNKRGMPGDIVGVTPHFYHNDYSNLPRGCEIDYWLDTCNCPIESYVILDDDTDMLYKQRLHYVKINSWYGLTESNANKAIKILNKKTKQSKFTV